MYLLDEEKLTLEKIALLSSHSTKVVKDVLFALLTYITMEMYVIQDEYDTINDKKLEIIIPFLCKLWITYTEKINKDTIKSEIQLEAQPLSLLCKEILAIVNNEEPLTKKYFRKQNQLFFKKLLEISETEDFEEEMNEMDTILS